MEWSERHGHMRWAAVVKRALATRRTQWSLPRWTVGCARPGAVQFQNERAREVKLLKWRRSVGTQIAANAVDVIGVAHPGGQDLEGNFGNG